MLRRYRQLRQTDLFIKSIFVFDFSFFFPSNISNYVPTGFLVWTSISVSEVSTWATPCQWEAIIRRLLPPQLRAGFIIKRAISPKSPPQGGCWTMEGSDTRAVMLPYQLSNLLLYKHELLLSKCPLTADWLLIRPLWNEISNEPLNYVSNTEHIISRTYTLPPPTLVCLFPAARFLLLLLHPASSVASHWTSPVQVLLLLLCSTECNCSGRSDSCVFDMEQYRSTSSGGHCVSCRDNTDGPHCERCRENHYRGSAEELCLPCDCNINGNQQIWIYFINIIRIWYTYYLFLFEKKILYKLILEIKS